MNDLIDSVIAFQDFLKKEGIPVAAIGGIAVAVWGEPRLTRDIDMKVLVSRENRGSLLTLLRAFTPLQEDSDESFRRLGLAFFWDSSGVRIDVMLAERFSMKPPLGVPAISISLLEKISVCVRRKT